MKFDKQIPFIGSWKNTFIVASLISLFVVFIMVFLQPFDTFQTEISYKVIKLSGYGLVVLIPILILHMFERLVYFPSKNWKLIYEAIYVIVAVLFISVLSYLYQTVIFSNNQFTAAYFFKYFLNFCIPFFPIIIPLLIYLRYRYGKITINSKSATQQKVLKIFGNNKEEELNIKFGQFVYAEAQQNYVSLTYLDNNNIVCQKVFRSTFRHISDQISDAYQVHRSYLINPLFIEKLTGNSRKRLVKLKVVEKEIPVSKKYHKAIKNLLQI